MLKTLLTMIALALAGVTASGQTGPEYTSGMPVTITNPNGNLSVRGVAGAKLSVAGRFDSGATADVDVIVDGGSMRIRPHRGRGGISLDIVLPADARISHVEATSGNVTVSGFTGDIRVTCHSGNVRTSDIGGGAVVRSTSGDVTVENIGGSTLVEASSGSVAITNVRGDLTMNCRSGNVLVRDVTGNADATVGSGNFGIDNVGGSVRAVTISGNVTVNGGRGNATVETASGNVELIEVNGNVDAATSSGNAVYRGELRSGVRYQLKSHSGDAVMEICGEAPGFDVTMQSYSGDMETEFPLTIDRPTGNISRSLTGRYRDGGVQIDVRAFSGSAKLLKCDAETKRMRRN